MNAPPTCETKPNESAAGRESEVADIIRRSLRTYERDNSEPAINVTKPSDPAPAQTLPADHRHVEHQEGCVHGETSEPATLRPQPRVDAPAHTLPAVHKHGEHQASCDGGDTSGNPDIEVANSTTHAPGCHVPPIGHVRCDPQRQPAGGWLELRIWAEMHHDAQLQRIASVNRAERGGVDPALYAAYIESAKRAENTARLGMVRCYRRIVPTALRDWEKTNKGIGEHLLARLLGHLGHPRMATPHHWEGIGTNRALIADEPYTRTVSQLWSYCGHGDPARRVHKGITAEGLAALGSPQTKMILHLLAEACMKQQPGNLFRDIYEQRRIVTADRLHAAPCVRCGPSGKPAEAGTTWSKGHQKADALRIVGKEILRDLWVVTA